MSNQDEIEVYGKVYLAIGEPNDGCFTCDLADSCFHPKVCCMSDEREDGRDVIFVEKQ
ncbi:hypothetical protein vBAspATola_28 [Aeromonas phage vB_AspA_Tola]|nr:hypothetical protein vBAspATola_28 [Aeromonas phage vB_AspA_Tola]